MVYFPGTQTPPWGYPGAPTHQSSHQPTKRHITSEILKVLETKYAFLMPHHVLRALIGTLGEHAAEAFKQPECVKNTRKKEEAFKFRSKVRISQMTVDGCKMYQVNRIACAKTQRKERESWMLVLEYKAFQPGWRRVWSEGAATDKSAKVSKIQITEGPELPYQGSVLHSLGNEMTF